MDKQLQESVFSQRYQDLPYSREWIRNGSAFVSWWGRKKVGDVGLEGRDILWEPELNSPILSDSIEMH